jgi:putative ABC transport system ATP-binding protein
MEIFQQLNSNGITIALVTHEADISLFASRNVISRDGKISREVKVENVKNARLELEALPADEDNYL